MRPACVCVLLVLALASAARAQVSAADAARFEALQRLAPLQGIEFQRDTTSAPVLFATQVPGPGASGPTWWTATRCSPWVRPLAQLVATGYAEPAGLATRPGRAETLVVILRDEALYEACRTWGAVRDAHADRAFFLPQGPAVVMLELGAPAGSEEDGSPEPDEVARALRPMLHALAHALLDARAQVEPPLWLVEGFAERLASISGRLLPEPGLLAFDEASLQGLADAFTTPSRRAITARPLAELLAIRTLAELDARVERLAVDARAAQLGLAQQASLFLAWLEERDGREPLARLLASALRGDRKAAGGPADLAQPAVLDAPFAAWVQAQLDERLRLTPVRGFTLAAGASAQGELAAGIAARPADLSVPLDALEPARARALRAAQAGALREALARTDDVLALPGLSDALRREVQVDRRALLALDDLRRRWLAGRIAKPVDLRDGGKVLRVVVKGVEGETLTVTDTSGRTRTLTLDALPPGALAVELQGSGLAGSADEDEARALAWLLAADNAWKDRNQALVRTELGPAGLELLARREAFEARLRLGRALVALDELAARELPTAPDDRSAWLARAREGLVAADLPEAAAASLALRALAEQVLSASFDADPLAALGLKGKLELLPGGRVRAAWDFMNPAQLADWPARATDSPDQRNVAALTLQAGKSEARVEDRWLVLRGTGLLRCALPLAAPLSLEYDLEGRLTDEEQHRANRQAKGAVVAPDPLAMLFQVRICVDERVGRIAAWDFANLERVDARGSLADSVASRISSIALQKTYRIRIEHDGTRVRALLDGREAATMDAAGQAGGFLEIFHHTDRPLALRRVVAEGALDAASLKGARAAWVTAQLSRLEAAAPGRGSLK